MKMDLWKDKTEVLNLRLSRLPSAKVLLKLEFDTEDQVLFLILSQAHLLLLISLYHFFFGSASSAFPVELND